MELPVIHLRGRSALVTGGSSGIGAATCLALARAGANVAINYRSKPEGANDVAAKVREAGAEAMTVGADVSKPEDVEAMFAEVDRKWPQLDILVSNAGVQEPRKVAWETTVEDWRKPLEVNLIGGFMCARQALQRMVPRGRGAIVFVSSVHEVIPWTGQSGYAASKGGMAMLMKTLAQEAAPHGVRVLSVAPGAIRTPINEEVWSDPEGLADLNAKIPVGRVGTPDEVGRVIAFLASDMASYMTGASVLIDGGMTLYEAFREGG